MTTRANFEKINLCECYDDNGRITGCDDAQCYSLNNCCCDARKDCFDYLKSKFNFLKKTNKDEFYFSDATEFIDLLKYNNNLSNVLIDKNEKKIIKEIKKWQEENECHTTVKAWTYHDSHNFKTLVLESDSIVDVEEIEEEEQEKILAEYPGFPHISGTGESIITENYTFDFDRWATNPWTCAIITK